MIAYIIPFSGCSHYLEASQLIYNPNLLTGFPVVEIYVERHFQAIWKIIFFLNRILLLLSVLHLAMIFFIFMVYLIIFTLYYIITMVCFTLVGKSIDRFGCFDHRSTFTDTVPLSAELFLIDLLLTGKTLIF